MIHSVLKALDSLSIGDTVPTTAGGTQIDGAELSLDFSALLRSYADKQNMEAVPGAVIDPELLTGKLLPEVDVDMSLDGNSLPLEVTLPDTANLSEDSFLSQAEIAQLRHFLGFALTENQSTTAKEEQFPEGQLSAGIPEVASKVGQELARLVSFGNNTAAERAERGASMPRPVIASSSSLSQAQIQNSPQLAENIADALEALASRSANVNAQDLDRPIPTNASNTLANSLAALASDLRPQHRSDKPLPVALPLLSDGVTPQAGANGMIASTSSLQPSINETSASPHRQLETLIDNLTEARESGRSARGDVLLRHAEFGSVAMRIDQSDGEMIAKLSSRDPAFAAAAQAALNERTAITASAETSTGSQRGQDQSGLGGHSRDGAMTSGGERGSNGRDPNGAAQHSRAADAGESRSHIETPESKVPSSIERGRFA